MKRIITAVVGTIAGLFALLGFKTHAPIAASAKLPAATLPTTTSPTTDGSTASSSTAPSESSGTATPTPSTSSKSATSSTTTRTIAGDAIDTQYGTVQVQIQVKGSTITNASFLQLTAFDPRSAEINNYAGPILLNETLQAQSANIANVSGASFTSQGYYQSLQSALTKAGL